MPNKFNKPKEEPKKVESKKEDAKAAGATPSADSDKNEQKEIFLGFDKVGDGCIEVGQIGDVVRALGISPTNKAISKAQEGVDKDPLKRIGFTRFLPVYETMKKELDANPMTVADYIEGMKVFDRDLVGYLFGGELKHLLTIRGEKLTDAEVTEAFRGLEDDEGNIRYKELVERLCMVGSKLLAQAE